MRDATILRYPSIPTASQLSSASAYAYAESAKRADDRAALRADRRGAAIVHSDRRGQRVLVAR